MEYFLIEGTDFGDTALTEDDFSPLMRYEWFFYVFEAVPMFVNTFLMNWFHPAKYLPRSNKVFLAQDGVTEVEVCLLALTPLPPGFPSLTNSFPFLVSFCFCPICGTAILLSDYTLSA